MGARMTAARQEQESGVDRNSGFGKDGALKASSAQPGEASIESGIICPTVQNQRDLFCRAEVQNGRVYYNLWVDYSAM